jgi:hypothetical protein
MKILDIILYGLSLIQVILSASKKVIWDEQVSEERQARRVEAFNNWYKAFNPSAKVYARPTDDGTRLGLFTPQTLQVNI